MCITLCQSMCYEIPKFSYFLALRSGKKKKKTDFTEGSPNKLFLLLAILNPTFLREILFHLSVQGTCSKSLLNTGKIRLFYLKQL